MPIYEYECGQCGHYLEAIQKISDAPLTDCPACGAGGGLKKLVSAAGFRLKGTGWYETDFKHRGRKPGDAAGGDGNTKKDAAKDKAADTKPAADAGKVADVAS